MINIEAFFKISYGLYVVSSKLGDKLNGYISNTVFQVTSNPPQFAIACSKDNYTSEIIKQSNVFAVSILSREARPDIIGTFGYKSGKDVDKFESFNYKTAQTGAPVLLDDTLAWFDCEVVETYDVGTHLLFIGSVIDSELTSNTDEPLTYAYYRDVKKGKAPKNAPTYVASAMLDNPEETPALPQYYCTACGHIYDPKEGDPDSGIPPGTPFEALPDDWKCPVCGADKSDFALKE
jgi:Conserved protein/domain typically associated with flavoprotein oxygenases, DIM6/NTAB family